MTHLLASAATSAVAAFARRWIREHIFASNNGIQGLTGGVETFGIDAVMSRSSQRLATLLKEIRACRICEEHLPMGPRPVLRVSSSARLLIVGQAPGRRVHETGIPFNDPSGDRLRDWLGLERDTFYDETRVAIIPMGFCYPGTGKSGDLPPRKECAAEWREKLMSQLGKIDLTLVIGQYSIAWHLGGRARRTLAETVKAWKDYWPDLVPMPHPSPRNNLWLRRNPWFEEEVIPEVRRRVRALVGN